MVSFNQNNVKSKALKSWRKNQFLLKQPKKHGFHNIIWNKVFKNGPSEICERQPLKNLKGYGLPIFQIFKRLSSTNFTWSILEYFVPSLSI